MQLQVELQVPPGVVVEVLRLNVVLKQAEIFGPAFMPNTVISKSSEQPPIPYLTV